MRLLVLDGSLVLPSLVRHVAPQGFEVEEASSFERAVAILEANPPDAVIANISPSELPWTELKAFCESSSPQIPVLFESCVYRSPIEAGLGPLTATEYFLSKPYSLRDLRAAIRLLIKWAGQQRGRSATPAG